MAVDVESLEAFAGWSESVCYVLSGGGSGVDLRE